MHNPDVAIILGVPYSSICNKMAEARRKLTNENYDDVRANLFHREHFWVSNDDKIFFGPLITGWTKGYREDLDIRPDTIAYIERTFKEKFKEIYKIDFTEKLKICGVTLSDDYYDDQYVYI